MSRRNTPEREAVVQAVRHYLTVAGSAEVGGPYGLVVGLGRRWTGAQIRSALKSLGAEPQPVGAWSRYGRRTRLTRLADGAYSRRIVAYRLPRPALADAQEESA